MEYTQADPEVDSVELVGFNLSFFVPLGSTEGIRRGGGWEYGREQPCDWMHGTLSLEYSQVYRTLTASIYGTVPLQHSTAYTRVSALLSAA